MNLKKLFASFFFMFTMLVSCGSKEETKASSEGLTGTVSVQVDPKWLPYYEAAVSRVKEKNPEAVIELKEYDAFDHLEILDKTDTTNQDVADIYAVPLDRLEGLITKEALATFDAKSLADRIGGFNDFDGGMGSQLKIDGQYYGFPYNIETLILGYNPVNLKANGISLDDIDFAKLSPSVAMIPLFNAWWGVAVTNAFDLELLGKDGDKFFSDLVKDYEELSADQQAMFEGLYNYWKSASEQKIPMFDKTGVYGYMDSQFSNGKSGSLRVVGPWEVGAITNITKDFAVDSLSKAKFAGKELKHWKGGWALVINARNEENEQNMLLAQEVIAELLNPQFAGDLYATAGKIMPNVTKEEYEKLDIPALDKEVILSVIDSYEKATSRPLFKEWGQVWDTWENALLSWEAKKPQNAKDAYKEVQASFKALLTNLGQ